MTVFGFFQKKNKKLMRYLKPEDLATAKDYLAAPEEFVRLINVTINGKLRDLITYVPNANGYRLRKLHRRYAAYLNSCYQRSDASYAYAKKKNIVMCVNNHLKATVFLKTDIHKYFDSVSLERMLERVRKLGKGKDVDLVTKACFYQGRLPMGFISSPVLSDLFLVDLDQKYSQNTKIIYTRYADDFIVSGNGLDAQKELDAFRAVLEQDLKALGLELNRKKTYIRTLSMAGDAIHVLGVNIVKTETDTNRITVSDRYIRKTCKALCAWINGDRGTDPEETWSKLAGQIAFIRQCSADSYAKLQKMTRVKSGYCLNDNGDLSDLR